MRILWVLDRLDTLMFIQTAYYYNSIGVRARARSCERKYRTVEYIEFGSKFGNKAETSKQRRQADARSKQNVATNRSKYRHRHKHTHTRTTTIGAELKHENCETHEWRARENSWIWDGERSERYRVQRKEREGERGSAQIEKKEICQNDRRNVTLTHIVRWFFALVICANANFR